MVKNKWDLKIEETDRCSMQRARNAGKLARYRSSRQKADRCTAGTATSRNHDSEIARLF